MVSRRKKIIVPVPTGPAKIAPAPEEGIQDEGYEEERIILKYKEKISNPLTAIRSMCVECMGGMVQAVTTCTSTACSLHPFRMGKNTMHGKYGKANPQLRKRHSDIEKKKG